jgi:hypothetical protein
MEQQALLLFVILQDLGQLVNNVQVPLKMLVILLFHLFAKPEYGLIDHYSRLIDRHTKK